MYTSAVVGAVWLVVWGIKKYGEDKVLLLESQQVKTAKISVFEYEELIKFYQQKIKYFCDGK